jgi:hypothetical protein
MSNLKLMLEAWNHKRMGKKYKKLEKKLKKKLKKLKPTNIKYYGADGEPVYHTKKPLYKLGSAEPINFFYGETTDIHKSCGPPNISSKFTCGYNSFSGIDIKICFNEKPIGTIQGYDFERHINADDKVELTGDIVCIMFDQNHDWIGKTVTMTAVAANEYGVLSCLFSEKIKFISQRYGISVDDIVSEEWYTFKGVREETIEEHQERISKTTGIIKPKEKSNEAN